MMEVKGGTMKNIVPFIKDTFGEEAYEKWLNALPQESKDIFTNTILSSVWYPYKWGTQVPQAKIIELFYNGDVTKGSELGRYSTEKSLKGLYRVFLKLLSSVSPSAGTSIVGKIQQTLSAFMRPIKVEMGEGDNSNFRIVEYPEIDEIAEYSMAASFEKTLEIMNGKKPVVKIIKSMAKGDEYTEFEIII
jgi:hypothetical protein